MLPNFFRNYRRSILVTILFLMLIVPCGLVLWSGLEIASPSRRQVLEYHRVFLDHPVDHGMRIDRFTASDGTPCLVCSPTGQAGDRGMKIRRQLVERGVSLPAFGEINGTLVLCHGRKGRKEDYLSIAERLCAAGFRCVIPDLPAHGDHPSSIATYGVREAGLPARVLDEASGRFGFEKQPAGLLGMSMGGSVAVHAADQPNAQWKALVVISSFDSFPAVIEGQAARHAGGSLGPLWAEAAAKVYHWKSGVSINDIQPSHHAASIHIPSLIAYGTADRVVSMDSGQRLFNAFPGVALKKWVEVPGAGHDNVLITEYPIYADITEWMLRHVLSR